MRTEYADDALRVNSSTTPEEVRGFVERRVRRPLVFENRRGEQIRIWDFNNHRPNLDALDRKAYILRRERYHIPFNVTGLWGFMQDLLPPQIRDSETLSYSEEKGLYKAYVNLHRESSNEANRAFRQRMQTVVEEEDYD